MTSLGVKSGEAETKVDEKGGIAATERRGEVTHWAAV